MSRIRTAWLLFAVVAPLALGSGVWGQAPAPGTEKPAAAPLPPSAAIKISDEPKGIDPAALLPPKLAAKVTARFDEASLAEVAQWLQTEAKLPVVVDAKALADVGLDANEPITDELDNLPVYLLLKRLRLKDLTWYEEEGLIHITTPEAASSHLVTTPYNIGDLLDAGHQSDTLQATITTSIAPTMWEEVGGPGSVVLLGDVLFVSQTAENHLKVAGLLAALRKHGRRTYALDEPVHDQLRAALDKPVDLEFNGVPLQAAVAQLAKQAGIAIRLDHRALLEAGVRERQPVSATLSNQKLRVVLRVLLERLGLSWVLRDGAVWITSPEEVAEHLIVGVYDVRDLCRNPEEADSLKDTVQNQIGDWSAAGGAGEIHFPVPGAMVVYQTEGHHDRLLALLESYRAALRISKPRPQPGKDPNEVLTRYYRMPTAMATDLHQWLPQLIEPETWRAEGRKDAPGSLLVIASKAQVEPAGKSEGGAAQGAPVLIPYSVLVVRQTRAVHDRLPELFQKVELGEVDGGAFGSGGLGGMGGLGGGGQFGGGFFSVPSQK